MKRIRFVLFILAMVSMVTLGGVQRAQAAEPGLEKKKVTLVENYEPYTIRFKNVEDNAAFTCVSSRPEIAEADADGTVYPKSAGTAIITVTIEDPAGVFVRELEVTVLPPYYDLVESGEGCHIGESIMFSVEEYGYDEEVHWYLEGSQYATLTPMTKTSAMLTGKADGYVKVTVSSRGKIETVKVRILEGSGEIYVVSPQSEPFEGKFKNYSSYNSKSKNYYMLRSYLERLDKAGGGTLILKKGTYTVTNILCIPSNTKVLLTDGVVISKSYDTGSSSLIAHRSIFHMVSYSDYNRYQGGNTYSGLSGYSGAHNIKLIGEGSATIDLNSLNTCAVVMCHNKNIEISGISFLNMNTNHFIELDAATNVYITDCLFKGYVPSSTGRKEAINIDTPDMETGGFAQDWSSYDCTPVKNIFICDNTFIDLESAIGTHKYTEGSVHTGITITGNLFYNMTAYAIRAMNWSRVTIKDNHFANYMFLSEQHEDVEDVYAIVLNGVSEPSILRNRFENLAFGISAYHWKNSGYGASYAPIYNVFTEDDFKEFKSNTAVNLENPYMENYPEMNSKKSGPKWTVVEKYDYIQ